MKPRRREDVRLQNGGAIRQHIMLIVPSERHSEAMMLSSFSGPKISEPRKFTIRRRVLSSESEGVPEPLVTEAGIRARFGVGIICVHR
jgi:hypothetical protein